MCMSDLLNVCLCAACVVCSDQGGGFPEGAGKQTGALC